ncbi:hypothetical protein WDU94_006346 [Cyamophila willieti]
MIVFFHMLYYATNTFWNRIIKPKLFAIENKDTKENDKPKQVEKRTQLYELERPGDDNSMEYNDDYDPNKDVCVYDLLSGKLTFVPPLYIQRYQAVMKVLTQVEQSDKIQKIAEFGCAEFAMFKYYKNLSSVNQVLFVDIDEDLLVHKSDRVVPLTYDYLVQRETELSASLFCGDVSVPDKRMNDVDVVVAIELIEHLYPPTLEDVPYNLFGVIQPGVIIITTPNGEFNYLFDDYVEGTFRHDDHKFEWTREQFQCWAENLVTRYPMYSVRISGIGPPPACKSEPQYGHCSQMAVFTRIGERNVQTTSINVAEPYKLIKTVTYPVKPPETRSKEQILFDEMTYLLFSWQLDRVPLSRLYAGLDQWCSSVDELKHLLEKNCRRLVYKPEEDEYYLVDDSRDNPPGSSLSDEEELAQYDYEANRERDDMIVQFENENEARTEDIGSLAGDIGFKDSYNECWDSWGFPPSSSSTRIVGDTGTEAEEVEGEMNTETKYVETDIIAGDQTDRIFNDGLAKQDESVVGIDENGMGEILAKVNETIEVLSDDGNEENRSKTNEVEGKGFSRKEAERIENEITAQRDIADKTQEKEERVDKTENMGDPSQEKQPGVKIRCANLEKYIRDSLRDDAEKRREKRTSKSANKSRTSTKRGGEKSTNQETSFNVTTKSTNERASFSDVTHDNDADVDTSEDSSSEDEETITRNEKVKHLSQEKKKLEEKIEKLSQDLSAPTQGNIDGKLIQQNIKEQNAAPTEDIEKRDVGLRTQGERKVLGIVSQGNIDEKLNEDEVPVNSTLNFNLDSSHLPINSTTLSSDLSTTGSGFDSSSLNLSSILVDTTSDGLSSSNTQFEVSYNLNSHITEYDSSSIDDLEGKTGRNEARTEAKGIQTGGNETDISRHVEEKSVNNKSNNKLKDITNKTNQSLPERKLGYEKQGSNEILEELDRCGENSLSHQETTNILKEKSLNKEINKLGQKLENLSLYSPEKLGRTTDWVNQIAHQSMKVDGKGDDSQKQSSSYSEKQKATRRRRSLKLEAVENGEEIMRRKSLGAVGKRYQETHALLENERGDHVRQSVYQVEVPSFDNRGKGDFANQSTDQDLIQSKDINTNLESKLDHRETSEIASRKFVDELCSAALNKIKDIDTVHKRVKQTKDVQDNCAKVNVKTKTDSVDKIEKEDCKQTNVVKSNDTLVNNDQSTGVHVDCKSQSIKVENNNEVDVFTKEKHEKEEMYTVDDAHQENLDTRKDQEFSKLTDRVDIIIEKSKHSSKADVAKDSTKVHDHTKEIQDVRKEDVTKEVIEKEMKEINKGSNESDRKETRDKKRDVGKDGTNNESDQSTDEDEYLSCADTTSSYKTGHLDTSDTMSMFSCRSGDTQFETASEYQTSYYSGSDDSDATLVESDNETYQDDEDTDEE